MKVVAILACASLFLPASMAFSGAGPIPLTLGAPGPQDIDLARVPVGAVLATGEIVDGACRAPTVQGFLLPGESAALAMAPGCVVVAAPVGHADVCGIPDCVLPQLRCQEASYGSCVDVGPVQPPSPPDAPSLLACLAAGLACAGSTLPEQPTPPSPEPGDIIHPSGGLPPICVEYALHAIIDTGDTQVRTAMVWDWCQGSDPDFLYGQGDCPITGAGPQPGHYVTDLCEHIHQWTGPVIYHDVVGAFHDYHSATQLSDGDHTERPSVRGDSTGNAWCEFPVVQVNPYSSPLIASCDEGAL